MNLTLTVILVFTLTISCSDTTTTTNDIFVVPPDIYNEQMQVTDTNEPQPPHFIEPYYANFNFLVDSLGALYYFQSQTHPWTFFGLKEKTPPEFIDLTPTDIVAIPSEGLEAFFKLNIFNHKPSERVLVIGLLKDPVQSGALYKMTQILKDSVNRVSWYFRKATQEEAVVLDFKKRQAIYDSKDIHWDSTTIIFSPKVATAF